MYCRVLLLKRDSNRCRVYCVLLLAAFGAIDTSGQSTAQVIHPVLRLEKPKYLLGESIRFWVGAEPDGSGPIPDDLRKPCSLTVTKPDSHTEFQTIGWPKDGSPDWGWTGGWGIKAEAPGLYRLELECGGQRTEPVPLMVEEDEILHQLKATFEFEKSGPIEPGVRVPVVFSVVNDSAYPVRFPQRGVMMEGISISVKRDFPAYRSDFFYPWEKLRQVPISPDTYRWDSAAKIPSITLEPGKRFEQRLALEDAYQFEEPGDYIVTFSTAISVLVGDEQGPYANLCPIRVVAENSQAFAVSGRRQ